MTDWSQYITARKIVEDYNRVTRKQVISNHPRFESCFLQFEDLGIIEHTLFEGGKNFVQYTISPFLDKMDTFKEVLANLSIVAQSIDWYTLVNYDAFSGFFTITVYNTKAVKNKPSFTLQDEDYINQQALKIWDAEFNKK